MPKSRTQLIKEINIAREKAHSNLLYVKGLTKMKKKELDAVYKELTIQEKRVNKYKTDMENPSEEEVENRVELDELERERDRIKMELDELEEAGEDAKNQTLQLDELSDEDEDEAEKDEAEKEEEEAEEEAEKEEEEAEEEAEEEKPVDIRKLEKEVRCMLKLFAQNISDILDDYRGEELTEYIETDIINYHNAQKRMLKKELQMIYKELGENDFKPSFYNYIEKAFDIQMKKIDKYLDLD